MEIQWGCWAKKIQDNAYVHRRWAAHTSDLANEPDGVYVQ